MNRNYSVDQDTQAVVEAFFAKVRAGELSSIDRKLHETTLILKSGLQMTLWTVNKMYAWGNSGEIVDTSKNEKIYWWNGEMVSRRLSDEIETYIQNYLKKNNLPDIQNGRQVLSEKTKQVIKKIQESV